MSVLMPGRSREFGINTRSPGSARDCTENAHGFQEKDTWISEKFYSMVPGSTNSVRSQGNLAFWKKKTPLVSVLAADQKAAMPSAVCQARRYKTTLPYHMLEGSRNLKPAGVGEERCHGWGSSRDTERGESSWTFKGSLAFATKISTC